MLNRVQLIGNLTRDAEAKTTEGGNEYAVLNLATDDRYTDKEGKQHKRTDYHRVVTWRPHLTKRIKNLEKGAMLNVEGKLQTRSFEVDGETRWITEVVASLIFVIQPLPKDKASDEEADD